jgi:hypothetical protein
MMNISNSQILQSTTTSRQEIFAFANATIMTPMATISTDPTKMIPLKPCESLHLGYEPLNDEEAFALARKQFENPSCISSITAWTLRNHVFRLSRMSTSCERLSQLCHKFIYLNHSIDIIVPKQEYVNSVQKKSIYSCMINYKTVGGKHAKITISIHTEIRIENGEEIEEFVIRTNRLYGSSSVHNQFFNHLKIYIESDGTSNPIIARAKLTETVFSTAPPLPLNIGIGWNELVEKVNSNSITKEERHTLIETAREVKHAECKRRLKRLKDIRKLRREEDCSDDFQHVEYYQDESDSESSLDGETGYVRNRKSPYIKYEYLESSNTQAEEPASTETYDLRTADGIIEYLDHHSPYYNNLGKAILTSIHDVFSEKEKAMRQCTEHKQRIDYLTELCEAQKQQMEHLKMIINQQSIELDVSFYKP